MSYNRYNGGNRDRYNHHHHHNNHSKDDKTFCDFYRRIGACRHGERCSRKHVKPSLSDTVLLPNLYQNPKLNKNEGEEMNPRQLEQYFDHFFKDVFIRFAQIGEVYAMVVSENDNNHLNGNVYVKFKDPELAEQAVVLLNQEWFGGRPVHCELSPVSNFSDADCRAYETNTCTRGDKCNFMHVRRPTAELKRQLFKSQDKTILLQKLQKLSGDDQYGLQIRKGGVDAKLFIPEPIPIPISQLDPLPNEEPVDPTNDTNISSTAAVERLFAR